jgi:sugar lactone lactonase YvrE
MADDSGQIYIADKDAHAIRRIDSGGLIHTPAGTGVAGDDGDAPGPAAERRLSSPNGMWVRGDGTLYILDLGNSKVRRVSPQGEMTTMFTVAGGIALGRGLWVSDDESRAYVASGSRVLVWARGEDARTFSSGYRQLGNLAVAPSGDLVVTDRGAGRVYRIGERGERELIAGGGEQDLPDKPALEAALEGVRAVWFDDMGGYFLGTHESSKIWYVDRDGILRDFLGSGEVDEVRGLSIDREGNLLVVDDDHGFVRRLRRRD